MKFFICKDSSKFTKHSYKQYGEWCYYHDDKVSVWECDEYMVLYSGYLIEGDIEDACKRWSFKDENGNFFAVKLTKQNFEIGVDYFQQHKIFVAREYGTEITNWLPWMTIRESDVVRHDLSEGRELTPEQSVTFYRHINTYCPDYYDYWGDARTALQEEKWTDLDALADYIHECMEQHSNLIKSRFKNRFISLSEGIDSVLQSQYFYDDPQYMYNVVPCRADKEGLIWKQLTAKNFPNVTFDQYDTDYGIVDVFQYLKDSSSRTVDTIPTIKRIVKHKPDIVLYGVNGDEMFFKGLFSHLHMLALENKDERYLEQVIRDAVEPKRHHYGASYTLGNQTTPQDYINEWFDEWLTYPDINWDNIEDGLLDIMTPKTYNKHIACNNDVIATSLYNDRRIYHEVFKTPKSFLLGDVMESPIQRKLLHKFGYNFLTPHKDAVLASYEGMRYVIPQATLQRDIEQNL
jgi:hypothetical protein